MATKLFVGKLSYQTTDQELLELFSGFGEVISARVAFDRETRRSRGFGFVEMQNAEDAQEAISKLNGTQFGSREITVDKAIDRPASDRRPQGSGGGFRGGRSGGGGQYQQRYGRAA